ncbi:MAG TPA: SIMPL domain-containing protein [Gaiellaceae bacterium]|nr:SIMPL domain-containing protein [Gaiellaceae bacterium]
MRKLLIVLSSLTAVAALVAVTHAGDAPAASPEPADGITAHGTASVAAAPDRAELTFGVETQAPTAKAALAQNASAMRTLVGALRQAGATDLRTQYVGLSPRHVEGKGVDGYNAYNSVSATVRQLGRVGAVIDAAVEAGANQVSGPMFAHGDARALYRQALAAAVANARANAQALAQAAGLTLGRVTAVVETGGAPVHERLKAEAADSAGGTVVEPGTQDVTASVTVTFAAS